MRACVRACVACVYKNKRVVFWWRGKDGIDGVLSVRRKAARQQNRLGKAWVAPLCLLQKAPAVCVSLGPQARAQPRRCGSPTVSPWGSPGIPVVRVQRQRHAAAMLNTHHLPRRVGCVASAVWPARNAQRRHHVLAASRKGRGAPFLRESRPWKGWGP